MAETLGTVAGLGLGIGLIGAVFWFTFRSMPDAREPPKGQTGATSFWSGWGGGSNGGAS